tara:strand:+ start:802 stop:1050 length:249 start_codon:yes stop_codon:yes gene_type:complete
MSDNKDKVEERKINIDGKEFKESELPQTVVNNIAILTDINHKKMLTSIDLDKLNILASTYSTRISDEMKDPKSEKVIEDDKN